MFGKKENVEVKTEEKKKSKKKTVLIVVVVLFLFLAIAGSDDNQSKNTVATSTNAVETENTTDNTVAEEEPDVMDGITEEDYIANNQERTGGEESQEPTTKDNKTTETTDKKNTNSNSVVEVSNISPTGMRFKKTWSELKPQLDKYFANDTVEWKSTKLTEEFTEYNMIFRRYRNATYEENMSLGAAGAPVTSKVPFNAFYFTFTTENSSDKILGIDLVINDKYDKNSKEEENCFSVYGTILAMFDKSVCDAVGDFMLQIGNSTDNTIYYKDNLYVFDAYEAPWGHIALFPCDYENAQYHKEHKTWKKFNNN